MAEEKKRNALPPLLANHSMANKYKFIDYDDQADMPMLAPGFIIDDLRRETTLPAIMNREKDPIPDIKSMTMDDGDILLCCPGKTGQHLNFEILNMLLRGNAEYMPIAKEETWFDVCPLSEIHEQVPRPRVLCTHLGLSWLPTSLRRPDTKVIFTMRNLKDSAVSLFKHLSSMASMEHMDWNKFFNFFVYGKRFNFSSLFDLFADVWDNHRDDPNVHIVWFEDLKQNTKETITKVADHLGVAYTTQLIDDIAEASDINKMRSGKEKAIGGDKRIVEFGLKSLMGVYRKGQVGDWKNYFTVQQNEEFDRIYAEWNKERQIPMRFE